MRDPTRGGLATTLNEFVEGLPFTIEISEAAVPVTPGVRMACELLGLDPLYCACEGRIAAVIARNGRRLPWPLCGPCRAGRAQRRLAG